jgi:hypothetical protein
LALYVSAKCVLLFAMFLAFFQSMPPPFLIALIFVFFSPYVQHQNCYFTLSLGTGMFDTISNK